MNQHRIGLIGGTGLYHIDGFSNQRWVRVKTPFGPPSDAFLTGTLAGRDVVFLPRHGRGHRILPSELNHRANLWAMKKQEKQVAAANAKEDQRYAEQQATSAQNTAFNQGVTKTKEARTAAADRLAGIQGLVGQQQKKFVV